MSISGSGIGSGIIRSFSSPYEKYDKTKDGHVYCVCCAADNDLRNDRCCKCGVPLLK